MFNNQYNFKDTTEIYHVVKYLLNKRNSYVDICETPIYVSPNKKVTKLMVLQKVNIQIENWVEVFVENILSDSNVGGVIFHSDVISNLGTNEVLTWRYCTLSHEEVEMLKGV